MKIVIDFLSMGSEKNEEKTMPSVSSAKPNPIIEHVVDDGENKNVC